MLYVKYYSNYRSESFSKGLSIKDVRSQEGRGLSIADKQGSLNAASKLFFAKT